MDNIVDANFNLIVSLYRKVGSHQFVSPPSRSAMTKAGFLPPQLAMKTNEGPFDDLKHGLLIQDDDKNVEIQRFSTRTSTSDIKVISKPDKVPDENVNLEGGEIKVLREAGTNRLIFIRLIFIPSNSLNLNTDRNSRRLCW